MKSVFSFFEKQEPTLSKEEYEDLFWGKYYLLWGLEKKIFIALEATSRGLPFKKKLEQLDNLLKPSYLEKKEWYKCLTSVQKGVPRQEALKRFEQALEKETISKEETEILDRWGGAGLSWSELRKILTMFLRPGYCPPHDPNELLLHLATLLDVYCIFYPCTIPPPPRIMAMLDYATIRLVHQTEISINSIYQRGTRDDKGYHLSQKRKRRHEAKVQQVLDEYARLDSSFRKKNNGVIYLAQVHTICCGRPF